MNFQPNQITKEHVLRAIQKIEKEHLTLIAPTRWYVEINGQKYPPKEVMRYAHEQMNGEKIWNYGGGEPTNKYLKQMGFVILDKTENPVLEMISNYKKHLREHKLSDELYKWQLINYFKGRPRLDSSTFVKEILEIDFNNLIYSIAVGAIRQLTLEETESYRQCLVELFDENKSLHERIKTFDGKVLKLYRALVPNEKLSHHHDERTISVLLTYHDPEKYTFFKDSYYQKYCKLLNIKAQKKGDKYVHYLELIEELIEEYLRSDIELVTLFKSSLPTHVYQDEGLNILAQDILFTQLDNAKMMDNETEESQQKENTMKQPLNQILYGPPGTGKTYHTINKAVAIANPEFKDFQDREKLKKEYDRLVKEGQIVFTTFHQSMSYEDFIEGIKPIPPDKEGESVIYRVQDGVFKLICSDALAKDSISFNHAYEAFLKTLSDAKLQDLKTPKGADFAVSVNRNGNLTLHTGLNKEKQGTLTKENILKEINGEDKFIGWEGYFQGVINHLKDNHQFSQEPLKVNRNYVLIIDEINRGNVSQIFGELITLIEEDKRLGNEESLKVTLPYSKKEFGVPPNLYIIGTMNTADRSVEALDTALRRRFSFEEMESKPELLQTSQMLTRLFWKYEKVKWEEKPYHALETTAIGLFKPSFDFHVEKKKVWDQMLLDRKNNVVGKYFESYTFDGIQQDELLKTINLRIEKLLSKDHQIGHAYLMNVYSEEELKYAFYNKIIPLLQEYFYGDYGKIGLVLGKGFVKIKSNENDQKIFADFDPNYASDYSGKEIFEIIDYRKGNCTVDGKTFTFQEAVKAIYTK